MTSLIGALTNRAALPFAAPARNIATYLRNPGATSRVMENVGTVYAIVSKTSEAVASVNWRLYRKSTDNRRKYAHDAMDDRREVTVHRALDLWNNPNPHMTRQLIVERYAQYMYLTGESWWHLPTKSKSLGPYELWPVMPDRMAIIEDPVTYISGYEYRSPDGQRVHLDPDEVIFSKRPNPYSEYRGIGPVQSILAKSDSIRYSDEWNLSYFLNSAEPGGILKVGFDLKDREIERIQSRWEESFRGASNANRMAIMDIEDGEWIPNPNTQRDMQFTELQSLNSEKIREAFAFPKFMLGTTEDANRASAEASEYIFARWTVVPILERIKQELNYRYLPLFGASGQGIEFDYESPLPEDEELRNASLVALSTAASTLITAGFDGDDVRDALGLPAMEFGGTAMTPTPAPVPSDNVVTEDAPPGQEAVKALAPPAPINAQRWVAVAQEDSNTCEPCRGNNGTTYKNRADAYADYPDGTSYKGCVGEEYGNQCRCKVVKRGRKGSSDEDTDEEVSNG